MNCCAWQALERRDVHGSVMCLRKQLAKSRAKPDRLHRLAACILCSTPEELRHTANWPGAGPASRQRVVEELQVSALPGSKCKRMQSIFFWLRWSMSTRCKGSWIEQGMTQRPPERS